MTLRVVLTDWLRASGVRFLDRKIELNSQRLRRLEEESRELDAEIAAALEERHLKKSRLVMLREQDVAARQLRFTKVAMVAACVSAFAALAALAVALLNVFR